jgi:hypothetical protein
MDKAQVQKKMSKKKLVARQSSRSVMDVLALQENAPTIPLLPEVKEEDG